MARHEGVSHAEGMERGGNRFSQADIKIASEAGLIRDEANRLKAMKDRSLELYVFRQEVADTLIADTCNIFLPLFCGLRKH